MVTKSKLSGWLRAGKKGVVAAIACLIFAAACGEKEPPPGSHWTAVYRSFGGNKPAVEVDRNWQEFLNRPVLGDVNLRAPSVTTALTELNALIQSAGGQMELQIQRVEPDHESYQAAIDLNLDSPTVAKVIDEIARESDGLVWDFQDRLLVIRPKS